jgi:hypothetical protein
MIPINKEMVQLLELVELLPKLDMETFLKEVGMEGLLKLI